MLKASQTPTACTFKYWVYWTACHLLKVKELFSFLAPWFSRVTSEQWDKCLTPGVFCIWSIICVSFQIGMKTKCSINLLFQVIFYFLVKKRAKELGREQKYLSSPLSEFYLRLKNKKLKEDRLWKILQCYLLLITLCSILRQIQDTSYGWHVNAEHIASLFCQYEI